MSVQDQIPGGPHPDLDTDWVPEFGGGPFRPLGGWHTLAEPTYAVSRDGEARRLEAGSFLAPLHPDQQDSRVAGAAEVQLWTEPEWPYHERPVSFWFVAPSALRFEQPKPPRMDFLRKLHADGALFDDELRILTRHYGEEA